MTKTFEQELAEIIEREDYAVRFACTSHLHVHLYYVPAAGRFDTGEFSHEMFGGPWRFRRAARWIRKTTREHRKMIAAAADERKQ